MNSYIFSRLLFCFLLASTFFNCFYTQNDTNTVQTLEFSDITKRRGWYIFPSDTNQYRQILMYYTLKCDAATTQDNYHCGEWDYTTYTRLYQHKNVNFPYYFYKNINPETITYNDYPKYDIVQDYNSFIVYDSLLNENNHTIGAGNSTSTEVLNSLEKSGRSQFLILASELANQGLTAGSIDKLTLNIASVGEVIENMTLKLKASSLTNLSDSTYEKDNLLKVYENITPQQFNAGNHTFNFTEPFTWNGSSNLVIDFSFNTALINNNAYDLSADDYGYNLGVYCGHNGCLDFKDDDIVDVPSSVFNDIDSAITISFWCYGDENHMPFNSYIFEGRDTNGYRVVNCHLPWSNSRVYWDAGNNGTSSYDRVHELATINDFSGKWNHWAFTKDVATGEMIAYLNGEIFMSTSGKTRLMSGIAKFRIGGNASSGFNGVYDGKIDEFRIWNKALDQATIKSWMNKPINTNHPFYNNLQAAYDFNQSSGFSANDYSINGENGTLLGLPRWDDVDHNDRAFNINTTTYRPKITLVNGSYLSHIDSVLTTDTLYYSPVSIIESSPFIDMNTNGISKNLIDTLYVYESGWGYTFNSNHIPIDSINFGIDHVLTNYYKQDIHQIQNYVTPYGIGLDLGPNGFRWVYDVTDYYPLFKDTVEISAGNQQELIDLKFLFIEGTPARDVIDFKTIWRGDYGHANIANDISLPPVDVPLNPNASQYKIKTRTTGHWFGGFQNCAEFCPKLHHLKINGTKQFEWLNWKECSTNPVIAQGGTWIYDRAGWCPGTFGTTYNHEITPYVNPGDSVNIDYGMEVTSGGMEGNYRLTVQLVSYGDYNFQNDASIIDVVAPNKWEFHNRFNPICDQPKIIISNNGEQALQSAKIEYWICGGPHQFHTWSGNLAFDETTEIELPITDQSFWDHAQFCKSFHVAITEVNGVIDENSSNNFFKTEFETPPVYPEDIVLWTMTNGAGNETKLYVKDDMGNDVFSRFSFQNNTLHKDTVSLSPGCYKVILEDTDEDGLYFFANNDGTGTFQIRKLTGAPLKGFDSDFGDKIIHYFTVGYGLNINEDSRFNFNCFPNPVQNTLNVETSGFTGEILVEVLNNLGQTVFIDKWETQKINYTNSIEFNLFKKGIYFLRISDQFHTKTKQIAH